MKESIYRVTKLTYADHNPFEFIAYVKRCDIVDFINTYAKRHYKDIPQEKMINPRCELTQDGVCFTNDGVKTYTKQERIEILRQKLITRDGFDFELVIPWNPRYN